MAEREELQKRYAYHEMSSKVEQADRSLIRRIHHGEATGEVESLRGKSNIGRMGDRIPGGGGLTGDGETNKKPSAALLRRRRQNEQKKNKRSKGDVGVGDDDDDDVAMTKKKARTTSAGTAGTGQSILDLGDLTGYQPSTERSSAAFSALLTLLSSRNLLGNQSPAVLQDAGQEVVSVLKDDHLRDPDRHDRLSRLLAAGKSPSDPGGLSADQFASLVQLGKQLDDYHDKRRGGGGGGGGIDDDDDGVVGDGGASGRKGGGGGAAVDDDMGVAVLFEESENEEDGDDDYSDIDQDVVVEASSSSEEEDDGRDNDDEAEGVAGHDDAGNGVDDDDDDEEERLVHGEEVDEVDEDGGDGKRPTSSSRRKKRHGFADRVLSVHEMDAHYLQRLLSRHFTDDADLAAKRASEVLDILDLRGSKGGGGTAAAAGGAGAGAGAAAVMDERECENRLLVLLGFDLFDTIKLILNNRVRIWATVSMKRAQTERERHDIEDALSKEASGEGRRVWEELTDPSKGSGGSGGGSSATAALTPSSIRSESGNVSKALDSIGVALTKEEGSSNSAHQDDGDGTMKKKIIKEEEEQQLQHATELDLEQLGHTSMTVGKKKSCELPGNSWRAVKKGYEEVHVPGRKNVIPAGEKQVAISELPAWTQPVFAGMEKLNRVQSKMCHAALETAANLLLCAPTSSGKTNVAVLTMLNILGQYRTETLETDDGSDDDDEHNGNSRYGQFDLQAFKIVYIAPMKALVQEQVKNFSDRLRCYGVSVRELSGDASLTRQEISETQVIVTTPEKWDVVTRQGEGRAYTQLVKLVIIDEIHLLHDNRGAVLESVVARVLRQVESTAEPVRLVGLSATLPNYADVAALLRVNPDSGLFFFDQSYRPVPLQMQYVGITERNAFKRFQLQNEICYEKAVEQRRNRHQVLIFVHSRAETGKTARALRDLAASRDESGYFCRPGSGTEEILREEAATAKHADLRDVLSSGFGIHHAGMTRADRELVEELFADRHIAVLCTTATLAWGVNLPAHAVMIRGTQIYNPEQGRWTELSPLDVLQMLGRAGRPQYDTEGEGIILTNHDQLQYYLSLTNLQLPVESQLIKTLPDHLNAEIVLGTVTSLADAADWLTYTFLYVRMLQNPEAYGISEQDALKNDDDPTLRRRRYDLAHSAACVLERSHLLRYDRRTGAMHCTPLGRVASRFYITNGSMAVYTRHMRNTMSELELLRLFALSGEFANVTVREDEKLELQKLASRVPIPIKESPAETTAKINVLLQSYVSRLRLDGFALAADMAFVRQSAGRIMRALFEIAVRRRWAALAKLCLDVSNMVAQRMWRSQSPLRQFPNVPEIVARKLERKSDIEWDRYADLTASDLGELVGVPKMGRVLHKLVHQFPKVELSAQIQPITRSMLRVELQIIPAFQFDVSVHGYSQLFHVLVEDVDGETILHHETFTLQSKNNQEEHVLLFSVPILEPLPPAYYCRVMSDRWLHSCTVLPISLTAMMLPAKFPPPTELLDLHPLLPTALGERALSDIYSRRYRQFNPVQTQTFHELYKTDRNCLVCAAPGAGKTACAEFAVLRMLTGERSDTGKCVYVAPTDDIADPVYERWNGLFAPLLAGGKGKGAAAEAGSDSVVVRLTGETAPDLKLLSTGKIVVASVQQWDMISRRWKQRKAVQAVSLVIFDELHFLGGDIGPTLEVVISRMRYISSQLQQQQQQQAGSKSNSGGGLRIVGLSASLANARDVGEWMGVPTKSLFNFSPKARPLPLEIYFQSFDQNNYSGRLMAMSKPVYAAVTRHIAGRSAIVYVPSRRQAQLTAIDIMTYHESQGAGGGQNQQGGSTTTTTSFLGPDTSREEIDELAGQLREPALQQVARSGIGFVHGGMVDRDWKLIVDLYDRGSIRVLVCPVELCWKLRSVAHLVVIMGTEAYDGREGRHVDYPAVDLLRMMGRHDANSHTAAVAKEEKRQPPQATTLSTTSRMGGNNKCVILCHAPKKEYLKKLLYDPLPIESHLDSYLHDPLNAEMVTKTVTSMQDAIDYLTWSFLYRRLPKNPTYYGLRGTSNIFLSEHLSEMIETVVGDLEESKCCQVSEEGDISPLNLGMIAAYYYVQYRTIELIASSVTAKTKIRGILEILSASWEYSSLPIRYGEEKTLKILARNLLHPPPEDASYDSNTKALILLQCHFSRKTLPADLRTDQRMVLKEAVKLIQAIVDVISSNGWLKPALAAMELSQMVVQGLWNKDHALKQIPHFTDEIISRCLAHKGQEGEPVESVFDILTLDDEVRNGLLQLSEEKMADVAVFCNNYPSVEVSFNVQDPDDVTAGDPVQIAVELEREVDDDEDDEDEDRSELGNVSCPLFPGEKRESWWIVVCDTSRNSLFSLKRVNLIQRQKAVLEFLAPEEAGDYDLTLFCMSDSYLGCDQQYSIPLSVALAASDDDDDEEEEEEEESGND